MTLEKEKYYDPDLFINEFDYNKELFGFIKAKVDPDAKPVRKDFRIVTVSRQRQFFKDKKKVSIIICPDSKCQEYYVETEGSTLVDQFIQHLKNTHNLIAKQEFVEKLSNSISYIRRNNGIRYTDPYETLTKLG
jgi:hypothetical protein